MSREEYLLAARRPWCIGDGLMEERLLYNRSDLEDMVTVETRNWIVDVDDRFVELLDLRTYP